MAARSKKIFWGIIVASLHINLFGLILFPSCFGYAILYFGIWDYEKGGGRFALSLGSMKYYRAAAAAMVLISGLLGFTSVFQLATDGEIWNLVPSILEYLVFYYVIEAYTAVKPELSGLRRGYALVMGAAVSGYGLSLMFHSGGWQVFSSVVILVCRLMVLLAVYSDRSADGREALPSGEPDQPSES